MQNIYLGSPVTIWVRNKMVPRRATPFGTFMVSYYMEKNPCEINFEMLYEISLIYVLLILNPMVLRMEDIIHEILCKIPFILPLNLHLMVIII